MTRTSNAALWLALALSPRPAAAADSLRGEPPRHVTAIALDGLARTDRAWLESYLGVTLPAELTPADAGVIEKKLLTTGVFSAVNVRLEPEPGASGSGHDYQLRVTVTEKWTTIPVARAAFGGGTPLKVLGAYDINAFGELLTLGAEARQYGAAPPGFVLYFRDPRGHGDRYYLGGEVWRDFRRRTIYDDTGAILGAVSTNMTMAHGRFLTALDAGPAQAHPWKAGVDGEQLQEAPDVFDASAARADKRPPPGLSIASTRSSQTRVLPTLLYDTIAIDNVEYDGARMMAKAGPLFVEGKAYGVAEVETFYYRILPADVNLAVRAVAASSGFNSPQSNYFLGGLDTVRGLPDGFLYGTTAAYANVELRQIARKLRYLWVQPAVFVDDGAAAADWAGLGSSARATAGLGVRLAVPQVYRMILRIDYGWSVGGKGHTQGITAGLNQFFDPYVPLASDPRF